MNLTSSLNLASETPLQKQQLRKIKTILQFLLDHNDSTQFRVPVDWKTLNLMDYIKLIKTPMDLGTVSTKIQSEEYRFVQEILDNIQLIWDNCKSYNQAGSVHSHYNAVDLQHSGQARQILQKVNQKLFHQCHHHAGFKDSFGVFAGFDRHLAPIPPKQIQTRKKVEKQDSRTIYQEEPEMNTQEKMKLMDRLKRLSSDHLGRIVQMIMENSPKAYQYVKEDKYNIYIQNIDGWLLKDIRDQLHMLEARRGAQISSYQLKTTKRIKF